MKQIKTPTGFSGCFMLYELAILVLNRLFSSVIPDFKETTSKTGREGRKMRSLLTTSRTTKRFYWRLKSFNLAAQMNAAPRHSLPASADSHFVQQERKHKKINFDTSAIKKRSFSRLILKIIDFRLGAAFS